MYLVLIVCMFSVHGKIGLGWPQLGQELWFPTNQDLANILSRTDLNSDNVIVFVFVDSRFPDFLDLQLLLAMSLQARLL